MQNQKVLILNFGGQYDQLIARRVRECKVYCEVRPYTMTLAEIQEFAPIGIIFTGGPDSVYKEDSLHPADAFASIYGRHHVRNLLLPHGQGMESLYRSRLLPGQHFHRPDICTYSISYKPAALRAGEIPEIHLVEAASKTMKAPQLVASYHITIEVLR